MAINLDDYGTGVVSDAIHGMKTLDMDALRERSQEASYEAADNACIYHHNCLDIINRYENDDRAKGCEDLSGEKMFSAADWTDAMIAWAYNIAVAVIQSDVESALTEIAEAADCLVDVLDQQGATLPDDAGSVDAESLTVSFNCPHGWAPHDREDAKGVHYWLTGQLEGSHAVAVEAGGIWLSYTWTANAAASA